ncbi:carotenoid oxygenase family protein [Gloeocapsa sp. PCC 73106]|uniref:carotenoid oxygenase family protein n=1 Tax=Gloeocapsa sp. PCC 73106 TaxID=102232 RepID=UPI0002AC41A1|nr:carotenoid oxygenase family protein [Gloeocapsa sp. PCC 73106]ELR98247.1 lignostilbene-alpha,beta-dioxygenase-like enzyme [Gloeocapsa sp. PCC 73106]
MQTIQEKSYNREDWLQGYQSQPQEYDYSITDIIGTIPTELKGTLFRNGPGLLDINGIAIRHPFDGDGMVSSFSFNEGQAHFRSAFVKTQGYVQEQKTGKILYRGVFGTQKPGGWLGNLLDLKLKNIANTNIIYWGGKLLALWEAAEPYRLDPRTLETLGIDYLDGILKPGDAFSAHPCIDPNCELDGGQPCLVNFAIKPGLSTKIVVYELSPVGKLLRHHEHITPGFAFIHDFAITPNYCLFLQNAVTYNPIPYVLGLKGAGECVNYHPDRPTRILIISRKPPYDLVKVLEVKAGFVFHHANAFESNNRIYLDSICYKSLPQIDPTSSYQGVDFESLSPGQLWRFELDLDGEKVTSTILESRCCEFPTLKSDLTGRSYRYLYLGAAHHATENAPLQAIFKIDQLTGDRLLHSFAPRGFAGEPIFVPQPGGTREDHGWVLTLVYNAARDASDLVILDGETLQLQACLQLKHHIPYGLHGSWTESIF